MVAGNQNLARMGYVKDSAQRWLEVSKSLDIYNSTLSYLCGCVLFRHNAANFCVLCIVELFLSSRWFTDGSLTSYIAADHEMVEVNG